MTYCINPKCKHPHNPNDKLFCCDCGSELLLQGRYRVIQILEKRPYTAVYEVIEQGRIKILKVLEKPDNKLVELFEKEAKVLQTLKHPGIPKGYGYFKFKVKDKVDCYPCFVMEKIEGLNLQEYIRQRENRSIPEELAVEWFIKLANILDTVHEKRLFHRDIKPANIMLRSDGEVVLIDFGAVREITDTYPEALANEQVTTISSQGYTAPEQRQGQAVLQSDFFSLGRTFVYLLTGIEPCELRCDPNDKERRIWRNKVQISTLLADFIDDLMEPLPKNRPQDTKEILQRLAEIKKNYVSDIEEKDEISIWHEPARNSQNLSPEPTLLQSTSYEDNDHISSNGHNQSLKILETSIDSIQSPSSHYSTHKKNQKIILPKKLIIGVAIFVITAIGGIAWSFLYKVDGCSKGQLSQFPEKDNLSCGEEVIITQSIDSDKEEGVKAFAEGRYDDAVKLLKKSWDKNRDSETLIYLNNTQIFHQVPLEVYTFAVVIPMTNNNDSINISKEILQGVAQAQDEFNKIHKNNKGIKILIASDGNNKEQAKKIAEALVTKHDVIGVVGHFTSDTTKAAVDTYQHRKLLLISPTATSEDLSNKCRPSDCYFRRVVYSDSDIALALSRYMLNKIHKRRAAIFYNSDSTYSSSIQRTIKTSFSAGGVVKSFDLKPQNFNVDGAMKEVQAMQADVLVILPNNDGLISEKAFRVIRANQSRLPIVGGDGLFIPNILDEVGNNAEDMVLGIPWHNSNSPNPQYPVAAKKLWKSVEWRTATSYDVTRVFLEAAKLSRPDRTTLEQIISKPDFKASGATGTISFRDGDRKENIQQLVKAKRNSTTGQLEFVPF